MAIIDTENNYTFRGWVARDYDTLLHFFKFKPFRISQRWDAPGDAIHILGDYFPELKWEDDPIKVNLCLIQVNEDLAKRDAVIRILEYTSAIGLEYSTEELIDWIKDLLPEIDINAPTKV